MVNRPVSQSWGSVKLCVKKVQFVISTPIWRERTVCCVSLAECYLGGAACRRGF